MAAVPCRRTVSTCPPPPPATSNLAGKGARAPCPLQTPLQCRQRKACAEPWAGEPQAQREGSAASNRQEKDLAARLAAEPLLPIVAMIQEARGRQSPPGGRRVELWPSLVGSGWKSAKEEKNRPPSRPPQNLLSTEGRLRPQQRCPSAQLPSRPLARNRWFMRDGWTGRLLIGRYGELTSNGHRLKSHGTNQCACWSASLCSSSQRYINMHTQIAEDHARHAALLHQDCALAVFCRRRTFLCELRFWRFWRFWGVAARGVRRADRPSTRNRWAG